MEKIAFWNKRRMMALIGVVLAALVISLMPGTTKAQTKILKIGAVINDTWPGGVDFRTYLDIAVPLFNESGGLVIGGERYNIELIRYDTKANAETGRAAVERLIDKDNVKFILGEETIDAWLPLTEANKVVVLAQMPTPTIYNPRWKYVFEGTGMQTQTAPAWGWLTDNFPNMKTFTIAFPDNVRGHGEHDKVVKLTGSFGQKVLADMYYPDNTTDFSSIAAKIKKTDPNCFVTGGGGGMDVLLYKALYEAGWKGMIVAYLGASAVRYAKVIPLSMVEGLVGATTDPFEFENEPLPPMAKKVKDAYVAKYGKYDNPYTTYWLMWDELIAALKKANSFDTDKVAAVLASGMEFDSVLGRARMVARPDFKNPRTISAVTSVYMMKIAAGKSQLLQKMELDAVYNYNKKFYNW